MNTSNNTEDVSHTRKDKMKCSCSDFLKQTCSCGFDFLNEMRDVHNTFKIKQQIARKNTVTKWIPKIKQFIKHEGLQGYTICTLRFGWYDDFPFSSIIDRENKTQVQELMEDIVSSFNGFRCVIKVCGFVDTKLPPYYATVTFTWS
jgi:hypothetical protein